MNSFKFNDKTQHVTNNILIDKLEVEAQINDITEAIQDIKELEGSHSIIQKNNKTVIKFNVGKDESGFNMGATPTKVKEELEILENININVLDNYSIEYCINVLVDFDPLKENRLWDDIYNMLVQERFKTSNNGLANIKKVKRGENRAKDNTVSLKGYKTGITCKVYDKFFEKSEKGKIDGTNQFLIRMEISFNKKGLGIYKINDIKNIENVKKLFKKYIDSIRIESNLKKNRWNKTTHELCDKLSECLN